MIVRRDEDDGYVKYDVLVVLVFYVLVFGDDFCCFDYVGRDLFVFVYELIYLIYFLYVLGGVFNVLEFLDFDIFF